MPQVSSSNWFLSATGFYGQLLVMMPQVSMGNWFLLATLDNGEVWARIRGSSKREERKEKKGKGIRGGVGGGEMGRNEGR